MRAGLALPQFDFSVAGDAALDWDTVAGYARLGEQLGFDSVWLCDHLVFSTEKYGGPAEPSDGFEPVVALGALARVTTRVRIGTLVFCEALRPASVLAKALASLDVIAHGRLDVGIGAGWYEPEYALIGMSMPPPGVRLTRMREAMLVIRGLLDGGPCTYDGRYHRAYEAHNEPAARQHPTPPIIVGGKGDRLLGIVAELADGWNTCWAWTFDDYRERVDVLERACERVDRDPATVSRSLGLYALCGESEADLEQRFQRLVTLTPRGVLDGVTLEQWRRGRLVGTVEHIREQVARWGELGVDTIVAGVGAVPFAITTADDVELLAHALELPAPAFEPTGPSAG